MTHLRIELNNGVTEEVSTEIIEKLYNTVYNGQLDNTSNLIGRLHTSATYQDYIDYLEDAFKVNGTKLLIIDSTKKYIKFVDPEVLSYWANSIYGDGVGIDSTAASGVLAIPNDAFNNNVNVQTFDELGGYFHNCTAINNRAFQNCSALTSIDLSNITSIGENVFKGCTSLGYGQTLELNLTNLNTYPYNSLRGTKYTRLILHSPQLLGSYDTRYPLYESMDLLLYLDLSDWRPAPSAFDSANHGDYSFYSNNSLVTYISTIDTTYIGTIIGSLGNYSNFRYFILLPTTPPILQTDDNNSLPRSWFYNKSGNVHIYVPDSAKAAYLADTDWASIGGANGSDTIVDRLHGLSELPAGVWTTGLASLYLTPAQLATS